MTPLSLSAMWHCVLATFQTRHDINNDARQHPDTNFSRSTSSLFFFSPQKKNLLNSRYVSGGVESAKPRSHEWKNHHICINVMHACMSTQHVWLKLLFIFIFLSPLSLMLFTLKPETLIFSGHLFYFE